jgi:F-type H+-transporting ATPase subunit b
MIGLELSGASALILLTAKEAGEAAKGGGLDATAVAFIALLIFLAILVRFGVPKQITTALDSRSTAIAQELADAKKLREEAEALLAQYQARKAQAEAEAEEIVAAAKEDAKRVAEETRTNIQAAMARRQKQAEDAIARAQAQAEADVRAAAAEAAITTAEQMLKTKLDANAHAKLIADGAAELARTFK